jgi:hypothetical protein
MQNTFPLEAMKETHEQRKTKIDIDELITGTANITFFLQYDIKTHNAEHAKP